jgi:hypothetical protein
MTPRRLPFAAATIVVGATRTEQPTTREILTSVAAAVLFVLAVVVLLVHQDPRTWQAGTSSGADSDVRTDTEALISAVATAAAAVVATVALLRRPRA